MMNKLILAGVCILTLAWVGIVGTLAVALIRFVLAHS
jgi:hypothetical protein